MSVIDLEKVKSTYKLSDTSLEKLVEIFLQTMQEDFELLENKVASKDFDQIQLAAHKLKSGFRYFQSQQMVDLLAQIQKQAILRDMTLLLKTMEEVKDQVALAKEVLVLFKYSK